MLDPKSDQLIVSIFISKTEVGLAALDISTGAFKITQFNDHMTGSPLADNY